MRHVAERRYRLPLAVTLVGFHSRRMVPDVDRARGGKPSPRRQIDAGVACPAVSDFDTLFLERVTLALCAGCPWATRRDRPSR